MLGVQYLGKGCQRRGGCLRMAGEVMRNEAGFGIMWAKDGCQPNLTAKVTGQRSPQGGKCGNDHVLLWLLEGKNCGHYLHQWCRGLMSFPNRASLSSTVAPGFKSTDIRKGTALT